MLNVFTVDLEDWYQGLEIDRSAWHNFEDRLEPATSELLSILDQHNVRATFFILGYVAERLPHLVKQIASLGHEIGSHGFSHKFIYNLTPSELKGELGRSKKLLEDLTGKAVVSFRAPFFSVTRRSIWALKVICGEGFKNDSSIFPVYNYRYGLPHAPTLPFQIRVNGYNNLQEFPITTFRLGRANFPFSGGAYFRILPYSVTKFCLSNLNRREIPVIFYIHPWELDPDQPRIKLPWRINLTHYANLKSTKKKLEKLLSEFTFTTLEDSLQYGAQGPVLLPEELDKV